MMNKNKKKLSSPSVASNLVLKSLEEQLQVLKIHQKCILTEIEKLKAGSVNKKRNFKKNVKLSLDSVIEKLLDNYPEFSNEEILNLIPRDKIWDVKKVISLIRHKRFILKRSL